MFIYRLVEPIDDFDGLVPLPEWISQTPVGTRWVLQAVLALADAAPELGWRGDMRHLPSVGPLPNGQSFMVVKQDDNGTTFIIASIDMPWLAEQAACHTEVVSREIGGWTHPTPDDIRDFFENNVPPANTHPLTGHPF